MGSTIGPHGNMGPILGLQWSHKEIWFPTGLYKGLTWEYGTQLDSTRVPHGDMGQICSSQGNSGRVSGSILRQNHGRKTVHINPHTLPQQRSLEFKRQTDKRHLHMLKTKQDSQNPSKVIGPNSWPIT